MRAQRSGASVRQGGVNAGRQRTRQEIRAPLMFDATCDAAAQVCAIRVESEE